MGICTQCGVVLHDDDMFGHKCAVGDLPVKGKVKKPVMNIVDVIE